MAIFNSYVKLPEGMFFSAAHCDSRQTARWPWTDRRRSCGHRWCSWRFFGGHPVPRWSPRWQHAEHRLLLLDITTMVQWYNQRQRQLVWSETGIRHPHLGTGELGYRKMSRICSVLCSKFWPILTQGTCPPTDPLAELCWEIRPFVCSKPATSPLHTDW